MPHAHWQLPPLELLLAFEAAARHLSFTKAGGELSLTQSAVSRQIQALEQSLGGKLFERRTRALLLTEAGQRFYRVTQAALGELDEVTRKLRGATVARTVTVTTTPGFASLWLIPRLNGYLQANPGVDVRISASYETASLEREGFDLAIRYTSVEEMEGQRPLFEEEVIPVCSPALAADASRPLREPSDLRAHVLLHSDDSQYSWMEWNIWLHAHGLRELKPTGALQFNQYDQLVQAAVNGQGVALGRLPLLKRMLRDKQLVTPFRKSVVSSRAYFIVRSTRAASKQDAGAFEAWLLEETRKEKALAK
ncbi:MAG: LysR family transcriptional regulator [Candidatus Parcubacteria bacterium]|nr:LysR family transcriptional regulator [Burkholderiales bacterium]